MRKGISRMCSVGLDKRDSEQDFAREIRARETTMIVIVAAIGREVCRKVLRSFPRCISHSSALPRDNEVLA